METRRDFLLGFARLDGFRKACVQAVGFGRQPARAFNFQLAQRIVQIHQIVVYIDRTGEIRIRSNLFTGQFQRFLRARRRRTSA